MNFKKPRDFLIRFLYYFIVEKKIKFLQIHISDFLFFYKNFLLFPVNNISSLLFHHLLATVDELISKRPSTFAFLFPFNRIKTTFPSIHIVFPSLIPFDYTVTITIMSLIHRRVYGSCLLCIGTTCGLQNCTLYFNIDNINNLFFNIAYYF